VLLYTFLFFTNFVYQPVTICSYQLCFILALVTDASGGSTHSSIGEQKVTLVFFLGGVTFAEVSALRFLAQLEDGNVHFFLI